MIDWVKSVNVKGLKVELIVDQGKTPLIFIEVDGTKPDAETILLYGIFLVFTTPIFFSKVTLTSNPI